MDGVPDLDAVRDGVPVELGDLDAVIVEERVGV